MSEQGHGASGRRLGGRALLALLPLLLGCGGGAEESSPADVGPALDLGDAGGPSGPDGALVDGGTPGPDGGEADGGASPDLGAADLGATDGGVEPDLGLPCGTAADCPGCGRCVASVCLPCICLDDTQCPADQYCAEHDCLPGCSHTGCPAGSRCDAGLRRCVPDQGCSGSAQCPDETVCLGGECVAPAPYSRCEGAQLLTPGVPFLATTRRSRDHQGGSCSRSPSPEAVFRFDLEQPAGVRLRVDGLADHFDARLFVRGGDCALGWELACVDTPFSYAETLQFAELQPGPYFLFVESFGPGAVGDFSVQVDLVPGGLCPDDLLEPDDEPAAAASLAEALSVPLILCPGDGDWYRSAPLASGDELRLAIIPGGEGLDPRRIVATLLDPAGQPLSVEPTVDAGRLLLRAPELAAPGVYRLGLLLAEAEPGAPPATALPYTVQAEVFTRQGTLDCRNPSTVLPGVTVLGDTRDGRNDAAASCTSPLAHTAPEVTKKFYLEAESSVTLSVEADWNYALYARRQCDSAAPEQELACRAPGRLFFPALAAGGYFAVVDGVRDEAGPFALTLTVGPPRYPPVNEDCASAAEILPGQTVAGSTLLARHDLRGNCSAPLGHDAPDVVYRLTLPEPRRVVIDLLARQPDGSPWAAALYVQRTCGVSADEEGCDDLGPHLDLQLDAGEHFLVVDGWRSERGDFELTVQTP